MSRPPAFDFESKAAPVAGNVEDTEDNLLVISAVQNYLNATDFPEVSLMSAQDFSICVFTEAGIGT